LQSIEDMEYERDFNRQKAFAAGAGLGLLGCFLPLPAGVSLWAVDVGAGVYGLWPVD
jgi:hypothetical protein